MRGVPWIQPEASRVSAPGGCSVVMCELFLEGSFATASDRDGNTYLCAEQGSTAPVPRGGVTTIDVNFCAHTKPL